MLNVFQTKQRHAYFNVQINSLPTKTPCDKNTLLSLEPSGVWRFALLFSQNFNLPSNDLNVIVISYGNELNHF